MADLEERIIGGLVVRIDRLLCVGFGDCIQEAPEGLAFDENGVVTFTAGAERLERERLIAACQSCPVDALTLLENGTQIAAVTAERRSSP